MKKLSFALGCFALAVLMTGCSADELELSNETINQELLVDDFDYNAVNSVTAKDGDEVPSTTETTSTNETETDPPLGSFPKKD